MVAQLVRRDFELRYKGSAAGALWGVIHPLVMLATWVLVFQFFLKVPAPDGEKSYALFVFVGYLPWSLFQDTVLRSSGSLVEQSNLLTKTVFPAEMVPLSIFFSSLLQHLIGVALAIAAIGEVLGYFSLHLLWLPIYMLFIGMLGVGLGWIAASLHVYLRDTVQVVAVGLQVWFWITPVMISESQIPERFRLLVRLNPLSRVTAAYRAHLLHGVPPSFKQLAVLAVYATVVFVMGGLFFRYMKRGFADVL